MMFTLVKVSAPVGAQSTIYVLSLWDRVRETLHLNTAAIQTDLWQFRLIPTFLLRPTTLSSLAIFSSGPRSLLLLHMLSLFSASSLVSLESSRVLLAFLTLFMSERKALWSSWISFSSSKTGEGVTGEKDAQVLVFSVSVHLVLM